MSTNFLGKTGEWLKENQADLALIGGFILIALISFGAGYLSAPQIVRNPVMIDEPNASSTSANFFSEPAAIGNALQQNEKGLFVASRGGTKYHWPWCSYAKNIKPENQIWFNSESEAKAAGYAPCACIKNLAPAGYISK